MPIPASRPAVVKADIEFDIAGTSLAFKGKNISVSGAYGLPWGNLSPHEHFGMQTSVKIFIQNEIHPPLHITAYITREQSRFSEYMGLKFMPDEKQKRLIEQLIEKRGSVPTDHIRKYPRIPSIPTISTFPLRAYAAVVYDTGERGLMTILFDIINISPNGIMLKSENRASLNIVPGTRLDIAIEPRGEFEHQIEARGMVCRTMDEVDAKTGNISRSFGIKILKLDGYNQPLFAELLRNILLKLKH